MPEMVEENSQVQKCLIGKKTVLIVPKNENTPATGNKRNWQFFEDTPQHVRDLVDTLQHVRDVVDTLQHLRDVVDTLQHLRDVVDVL